MIRSTQDDGDPYAKPVNFEKIIDFLKDPDVVSDCENVKGVGPSQTCLSYKVFLKKDLHKRGEIMQENDDIAVG